MPHRSIRMYIDAAYCYRWSSMVCRSVTIMSREKQPNQSRYCLGCGLGLAQQSTY